MLLKTVRDEIACQTMNMILQQTQCERSIG